MIRIIFCCVALSLLFYTAYARMGHANDGAHECMRTCEWPPQPKTCIFNFTIEWFYSMSMACNDCPNNKYDCYRQKCIPLNGVPRPIMVANKMFPGPMIKACENDTVVVNVTNNLGDNFEGTSLHWHGVHQRETQFMDGISMLTQCPIATRTSFTYTFKAAPHGTHWWHAHSGLQRADGVFGPMVFHQAPQADVNSALYDLDLPEHVVAVHDWFDKTTLDRYTAHVYGGGGHIADAILINGKGRKRQFQNDHGETLYTERETFYVVPAQRYRFRMFSNAITSCPLRVSVDSHKLTIIASDGASLEPYEADEFVINGGETFDFVLETNQHVGNYWMRVQGMIDCDGIQELALLNYEGAGVHDLPPEEVAEHEESMHGKVVVNPWGAEPHGTTGKSMAELRSAEHVDRRIQGTPDAVYYLGLGFNRVNKNFEDPGDSDDLDGHSDHNDGHDQDQVGHTTPATGGHGDHDSGTDHMGSTTHSSGQGGHGGHTGQQPTPPSPGGHGGHDSGQTTASSGHGGHGGHTEQQTTLHSGGHGSHDSGQTTASSAHGGHGGHTGQQTTPHSGGHGSHDSGMDHMSQTMPSSGHGGHGGHTGQQTTPHSGGHGGHESGMDHMSQITPSSGQGGHGGHMGQTPAAPSSGHDGHDTDIDEMDHSLVHSGHDDHAGHHLHYLYSPQINHRSFVLNTRPPLTQSKEIPEEEFCAIQPNQYPTHPAHCEHEYCECTEVIHVPLGKVVELVLVDEGQDFDMGHPMHLHGYYFNVVAQGKLGSSTTVEDVMKLDQAGNITRNFEKAPHKDTVIVQDGGYTIVRFVADNPGWWFFHCHVQIHVQSGMSLLVHVGTDDDLPPEPKNFPRCGPWPSDNAYTCPDIPYAPDKDTRKYRKNRDFLVM